jgi:hypothetical protein
MIDVGFPREAERKARFAHLVIHVVIDCFNLSLHHYSGTRETRYLKGNSRGSPLSFQASHIPVHTTFPSESRREGSEILLLRGRKNGTPIGGGKKSRKGYERLPCPEPVQEITTSS